MLLFSSLALKLLLPSGLSKSLRFGKPRLLGTHLLGNLIGLLLLQLLLRPYLSLVQARVFHLAPLGWIVLRHAQTPILRPEPAADSTEPAAIFREDFGLSFGAAACVVWATTGSASAAVTV